jgi:pilus assembly protein Flp/PilA
MARYVDAETTMMTSFFVRLRCAVDRAINSDEGQGLTEYALILALIAVVAIAALHFLGDGVKSELTSVATSL